MDDLIRDGLTAWGQGDLNACDDPRPGPHPARADFRDDLPKITVPTLVIHGDGDGVVPFQGSGARTHQAIPHSELVVVKGAPHGLNVSHATDFNTALVSFLSN